MMLNLSIPILCNVKIIESYIIDQQYWIDDYNGLFISPCQSALNFRHRMSKSGYASDWHVAGDATLILVLSGILRIGLWDNSYRNFAAGDVFIAQDKLHANTHFNNHTAQVIGDQKLVALHLKLPSVCIGWSYYKSHFLGQC